MSDSGKQSPLGINVLGNFVNNIGLSINSVASSYMGKSKTNTDYVFGSILNNTGLRLLTWAINDGYLRGPGNSNATLDNTTYDNLITIGASSLPALGNSVPPTYTATDPSDIWTTTALAYAAQQGVSPAYPGPATSGYGITSNTDQGQEATWLPYDHTNINYSVTQWGYLRLHALQAWNEFNWNGTTVNQSTPDYKEFCSSFLTASSLSKNASQTIQTAANANTFLDGTYSNMNDLISADITGVSLSTANFGIDLQNLGNALDLKDIATFGLPSNLLKTLANNSAISQDLNLVLLSSGLALRDITSIISGVIATPAQEQQIYGAFLIIAGQNLTNILDTLQCTTQGLNTLADLLNLRMLFPNSYATLTVPIYNAVAGPTNSKTYYLIYTNGGLNTALNSPVIQNYVGTIIPNGTPPVFPDASEPENYNQLPIGFGSYLDNVIPNDQATAAGAFSYSMRQINNIQNCTIQQFAQVVSSIEGVSDLSMVAGTSKPTDQTAINNLTTVSALGSGPNGAYTMSDFFGCMSGLPYPWQLIQQRISDLQTQKLYNIYQQLFLATTWEQATVSVQYSTTVVGPTTYYTPTGLTITDAGGGYGRGGAPVPTITISNGGTATCTIGTDDTQAGSNDTGTFGRITSITLTNPGSPNTSIPTATIQAPPIATLAINSDGSIPTTGTNTTAGTMGWTGMRTVVQAYITQANTEISTIQTNNPGVSIYLQTYWNTCGTQLMIEQRSRYNILTPVTVPKNYFLNPSSSGLSTFVDSIPSMAQDTSPHMNGQTLEAIADFTSVGGQSIVGMMRQERNQSRLQTVGINLDNNISNDLSDCATKTLTTNGTVSGAINGITSSNGNVYTNPAWSAVNLNGQVVTPQPSGIYDCPVFQPMSGTTPGDITSILNGDTNPVVNSVVPVGPVMQTSSGAIIIAPPPNYNPNNLPPNIDSNYINSTILPASLSVPDAIQNVTDCNCDCQVS